MVLGTAMGGRRGIESNVAESSMESVAESNTEAALALHERLVAYVHAVTGDPHRRHVWVEHSYARARDLPLQARELLAPRPPAPDGEIDVERLDPAPPAPLEPADDHDDAPHDDGDAPDDWEAKLAALAPSAAHARLAVTVADILRRLRLARLAGGGGLATRAAARRLRLALAPLWVWPGAPHLRPAPWLNAALLAHLPRSLRRLYDDMLSQLRRTAPRLTERLMLGRLPPAAADPLGAVGPARGPGAPGPVLAWLSAGPDASDARWTRRLSALLHVRELRADAAGAPDVWCSQVAASLRADLMEVIAEAGERGVVVCGCGGGAALAAVVGGAALGAVLLAPPLLTAEGGWGLQRLARRALLVVGTGAADSTRRAAHAAAARRRRLLLVGGADDALRLPHAHRARLKLPQHALDAAIVEEVYRWVLETGDTGSESESSPAGSPDRQRGDSQDCDDAPNLALLTARSNRSIEIVEGRVVTRVSGNTPLALLPPRRSRREERAERSERSERPERPERAVAEAPSAADILHMPIVFADDERTLPASAPLPAPLAAPPPLTVTSGDARGSGGRITRVIVAKRGRTAGPRVLRRAD